MTNHCFSGIIFYKRGGEIFQAPAENAVAQNGGEQAQQQAHHRGADAVAEEPDSLDQAGGHQERRAGGVDQVGIDRGGDLASDHTADEGIGTHRDGGQQG